AARSRRSRTTRAPSRDTSDRSSTRPTGRWGAAALALARTPRRPTDTNPPDCWRAATDRDCFRGRDGSAWRTTRAQNDLFSIPRHQVASRPPLERSGCQRAACYNPPPEAVMPAETRRRVALLIEEDFDDRELTEPLEALRAASADVIVIGPT